MPAHRKFIAFALLSLGASFAAGADDKPAISPQAHWMVLELNGLDVEHRWIAGAHVDWETGLPDNSAETVPGRQKAPS